MQNRRLMNKFVNEEFTHYSMPEPPDFLSEIATIIQRNLSNESFGVSKLAQEMHMSRSNLLRKAKKLTGLSASRLIRRERLKSGMEMLQNTSFNVSEVAHKVGFASTSYFIKCFREYYGYPPGEVGKQPVDNSQQDEHFVSAADKKRNFPYRLQTGIGFFLALAAGLLMYMLIPFGSPSPEKSIAVLPFKNDSNDSSNVYLINGLMQSTLGNLQKIQDLKVTSRTSIEKYRNASLSIPELAKELDVNYIVEGSGQRIEDQILVNIQLIRASTDKQIWSRQYRREAKDIFKLQQEIARNIADEIKATITPEEEKHIEKKPTNNHVAYDLYLKGRDFLNQGDSENLEKAVSNFKKAIEEDNSFALSYAYATIAYYYLDIFKSDKKYAVEMDGYSHKAVSIDPAQAECQIARALHYMHRAKYNLAADYLEKALENNRQSGLALHFLTDLYYMYKPNTAKYLEYALRKVRLDVFSHDSVTTSYDYLHLSNALLQTGFLEEALMFIDKSIDYFPQNPYSHYVKAYIIFARDRNVEQLKKLLARELKKDTARIDILQEMGKIHYLMKDFENAYTYYQKFVDIRENRELDIYRQENLKIGIVFAEMGMKEKSEALIANFKEFAEHDQSIYKRLYLAGYYGYRGDAEQVIYHMKEFAKEENYVYWILLWEMDASSDPVQDNPEYRKVMKEIEQNFWANHKKIRVMLEEKELL